MKELSIQEQEKQVVADSKKKELKRLRQLEDLRFVLKNVEGRRVFWRLMAHCRVLESIWDGSAKIHYNSGRQDVGHFVMSEVVEANEDAYLLMMKENKEI